MATYEERIAALERELSKLNSSQHQARKGAFFERDYSEEEYYRDQSVSAKLKRLFGLYHMFPDPPVSEETQSAPPITEFDDASLQELKDNTLRMMAAVKNQGQDIRKIAQRVEIVESLLHEQTALLNQHAALLTHILDRLSKPAS